MQQPNTDMTQLTNSRLCCKNYSHLNFNKSSCNYSRCKNMMF